jgi:hypothetical protein
LPPGAGVEFGRSRRVGVFGRRVEWHCLRAHGAGPHPTATVRRPEADREKEEIKA